MIYLNCLQNRPGLSDRNGDNKIDGDQTKYQGKKLTELSGTWHIDLDLNKPRCTNRPGIGGQKKRFF